MNAMMNTKVQMGSEPYQVLPTKEIIHDLEKGNNELHVDNKTRQFLWKKKKSTLIFAIMADYCDSWVVSKNFPFEKLIMSQNNIFQHAMLDLLGQSRRQYLGLKKKRYW